MFVGRGLICGDFAVGFGCGVGEWFGCGAVSACFVAVLRGSG